MANPIAGTEARIAYGWETTFNSAGTVNKAFSQGVRVPTYDIDNDPEYIYAIGSQDVQQIIAKTFKGTWGVEFIYSDPWWLRAILGGPPVTTSSAPYVHTWTVANYGISTTQTSLSIQYGFDLATDSDQTMTGCIANNASISCNVGDPIKVSLDGWYSGVDKDSALLAQVAPIEQPFTFAHGTFEFPKGTTITDVQSVELSWTRNNDPVYAIGSRYPQTNVPKAREWNIRVSSTYEQDSDFWDTLLGASDGTSTTPSTAMLGCGLTITNGESGAAMRALTISFGPTFLSKGSLPSSPEELVKTDIDMRAYTISSVIVQNATASAL